jgi:hypothetical protein
MSKPMTTEAFLEKVRCCRYADTFGEAIQNKKELYAIMIISNYIKFKKGLYPKYYMLNINFESISNEGKLHIEELD